MKTRALPLILALSLSSGCGYLKECAIEAATKATKEAALKYGPRAEKYLKEKGIELLKTGLEKGKAEVKKLAAKTLAKGEKKVDEGIALTKTWVAGKMEKVDQQLAKM